MYCEMYLNMTAFKDLREKEKCMQSTKKEWTKRHKETKEPRL